jgi:hypothetical protein
MQPPKQSPTEPVSEKAVRTMLTIASVIAVVWLTVIGADTLQAYQAGAMAKAAFGGVLLLGEIASFSYVMYRGLVHKELAEEKWHRISHWVLTAGAFYFLFAWKS